MRLLTLIYTEVLAEMVSLHFLSLMEALLECRSTILAKLMPLWCPVLHAYNIAVFYLIFYFLGTNI